MLARSVKLNCDCLHDVTKQLLIWAFKKNRNFSTAKVRCNYYENDNSDFDRRNRNFYGDRYNNRYSNRYDNQYRNNRYNSRPGKFSNDSIKLQAPDWSSIDLKPFKNDFYNPHPDVLNRSPKEIENFYKKHEIQVFGQDCPHPIFMFHELGLPENVLNYISKMNYVEPTPIQSVTWPVALSGRDMVGISRTGSGKTLGYVLPAIVHIQNQPPLEANDGPIALVMAPTRELVQQIQEVVNSIARASGIYSASLFGGASKLLQMKEISSPKEIYVATPGRLLDFLNDEVTNLRRCTYLVLDEADQMLNMGFEPQIRSVINRIRPDRQVLMWSATWPRDIRDLANDFLKNYIKIKVGSSELSANPNIIQVVHVCQEGEKLNLLKELLLKIMEEPENKTLIFAQTKFGVEKLTRFLTSQGIMARALHGDCSQNTRNRIMQNFRTRESGILIATNVAGRGLDVNDIKYVINFDFPQTVEEYVHKIGRTARSNDSGTAHTFFTPENAGLAQELISLLETTNQIVSPELKELASARFRFHTNSRY